MHQQKIFCYTIKMYSFCSRVVVEITSDMISDDGTTAEDIVTIIDRNKDSLPLSVSTVTSGRRMYM